MRTEKRKQESEKALMRIPESSDRAEKLDTIQFLATLVLCLACVACSSSPKVTVPEEEYEGLKTENRRLARELTETKKDYEAERAEQLKSREYLRRVEHPLTLKEEAELRNNCGVGTPQFDFLYYGSTYSEEQQKHFDLYQKILLKENGK